MPEDRLIRYGEAVELLGLSKSALYKLVREKKIPFIRLGPKTVRFSTDALNGWIKNLGSRSEESHCCCSGVKSDSEG